MERARGERDCQVCLSMYSLTEHIYYSQLSSVAILLQPEPVSHRKIQGNDCVFSPSVLSPFGLPIPPTCLVLTVREARSYFACTMVVMMESRDVANTAHFRTLHARSTLTMTQSESLKSVSWLLVSNLQQ
jgi:hypothetical protein